MTHDLRYAFRVILAHRWFSAAIVATLALGIGLNTMVFTLVNAVLFKPVPVPGGARLVIVSERNLAESNGMPASYPDFLDYRAQSTSFDGLEAGAQDGAILTDTGNPPQSYNLDRVSAGMFTMLHIAPVLGRGFLPSDENPGAEPVILIGYNVWKERYAGAPSVIGHLVQVDTNPATIIGVMPDGVKFPSDQDVWMPLIPTTDLEKRSNRTLNIYGILKPGTSIEHASAEFDEIAQRLATAYPDSDKSVGARVQTFSQYFNGPQIRLVFLSMQAAVAFVLLIVCANVANMMLSRALARQRELSIRVAIGASRWRVVRQLLIESITLSVLGGLLGFGLAVMGVHWFDLSTRDVGKPTWIIFSMNYAVFGYFAALCVFAGLISGLAPAIRSSRVDLNNALKDGTRSAGTRRGGFLSSVLVVFQFALTLVLLTGAGIFVRAFLQAQSLNPWLPSDHIMSGTVSLPREHYADNASHIRFFDQLLAELRSTQGVSQAAISSSLPGMGAGSQHIEIEDSPLADPLHGPSAARLATSPGYFAAINLTILRGRDFNETDGTTGRESSIVTKEFAARFWPNQGPVGKRLRFYEGGKYGPWITVVGVSADIVQQTNRPASDPLVFVPYRQEGYSGMDVVLRAGGNPSPLAASLRAAVQKIDQDLPVSNTRTLADAIYRNQWYLRLFGGLFLIFALVGLLIAAVGIYAMIAQATTSRTQEIGVRMALGASPRNILGLVLTRGMKQLLAGLIFGLAAAYPAARVMTSLPLRVSAADPSLFVTVALVLMAVGLVACWLPARRAAALDPVKAIRYE
jgi:predicted permease